MSLVLEGGAAGASLQSKARKASVHLSESITNVLNDSSLVFYRVNEHIHKKVPQLVEEKKALAAIHKDVKTANQDLEDARQTISGMQRITELSSIEALIPRVIAKFIKKSLSWLGITNDEQETEVHHEATSEVESGTIKTSESSSGLDSNERLYPDLREYITSVKSTTDDKGVFKLGKRPQDEDDNMSEAMRPDRVQLRYKLRKGLLDSVSNTENEDEVIAEPMANPFLERLEDVHKDTQKDSHKDVHKDPENQEHEEIDGLTEAELVLLGRIRRLTETPLEKARKNAQKVDQGLIEKCVPRELSSPYSVINSVHQEPAPAPKQASKPLDTILPYNRDHRRHRQTAAQRDGTNDYLMDSGDGGSDADESEHAANDLREGAKGARIRRPISHRERVGEITQSSPDRKRQAWRDEQRTSRGGLQVRSQVTPKRHVRYIPGRFSALDSDEEEESVRQHELEMEQRRVTQGACPTCGTHGSANGSTHASHSHETRDKFPGFRVPPQLYPTLNYGRRTKLYNPKLDEVLKWTSSTHNPSAGPDTTSTSHHNVSFSSSPIVSEVVSAAPAIIGALATAAGATGIAKLAADWVSAGDKHSDNIRKPEEGQETAVKDKPSAAAPALFTPPSFGFAPPLTASAPTLAVVSAPASAAAASSTPAAPALTDKQSEKEMEPEKPKETEKGKDEKEKPVPVPAFIWAAADHTNKWKCPTCDSYNGNQFDKCQCCETPKPGAKPAEQKPAATPSLFTPSFGATTSASKATAAPSLFTFGTPAVSSSTATTPIASAEDTIKKPTVPALFSSTFTTPDKPSEKALEKPAFTGFKMPDNSNKWRCPTCVVMNDNKLDKCPCCDTAKPGGATAAAPAAPAAPAFFSFKPPSSTPATSSTSFTSTPVPLFGGATSAASSAGESKPAPVLFGAPAAKEPETKPPTFPFGGIPASTSSSSASAAAPTISAPSLFGFTSTPAPASAGTSSGASAVTSAAASAPLFTSSLFGGVTTPAASGAPVSTSTVTPALGSVTPSPFAFGPGTSTVTFNKPAASSSTPVTPAASMATSAPLFTFSSNAASGGSAGSGFGHSSGGFSAPTLSFGQPAIPASSTPTPTTTVASTATSAPIFTFGSSTATGTPTGSGFGSSFGGFGTAKTTTPSPFAGTTPAVSTSTTTPNTGFAFGGTSGLAATPPTTTPSFTFGGPTASSTGGLATSSKPSPFAFGAASNAGAQPGTTGGGFGGFGSAVSSANNNNNNHSSSMMSPTISNSIPAMGITGSTGFGGFGSSVQTTGMGFGSSSQTPNMGFGSSTPSVSFGGATATPTIGFGSQTSAPSAGFGASTPPTGFGATGTSAPSIGFGGSAPSGGFGVPATTPSVGFGMSGSTQPSGFGATGSMPSVGFGAGAGPGQAAPFGQSSGGFGSNGQFGFQNISNAPGGAQYAPSTGGFSFNVGTAPAPGEMPANRKIAKMRKKR
ncbi:hypothetical protein BGZ54_008563 [Gamsiella multidivaricata]|nr:hypothetical protein BGZ54_008563 [Gamsiella multidivaricata]